ncbi:hypothetical protein ACFL2J_06525 [Candidatus Omnitrophota bacterium]
MVNDNAKTCWEFWNCDSKIREECDAYALKSGRECWMLVGSMTDREMKCPKVKNDFKECWRCPWFKKLNPDFPLR